MFRNLLIFKVANLPSSVKIAEAFQQKPLRTCGPLEEETMGFVTPDETRMDAPESLAGDWLVQINHCGLFAIGQEKKRVPGKLVNQEVKRQLQVFLNNNSKKPSRQTKMEIKQKVKDSFLAKAFAIPSRALGYFDFKREYIIFNTTSRKAGEKMLSTIREALGTLEAVELTTKVPMTDTLTNWVVDEEQVPVDWTIGDKMALADPKGGSIKVAGEELRSEELLAHIKEGKKVTSLAVEWQGKTRMSIDQDLVVRGLKFSHKADSEGGGDESRTTSGPKSQVVEDQSATKLTSNFLLLTGEVGEIMDEFQKHWLETGK